MNKPKMKEIMAMSVLIASKRFFDEGISQSLLCLPGSGARPVDRHAPFFDVVWVDIVSIGPNANRRVITGVSCICLLCPSVF